MMASPPPEFDDEGLEILPPLVEPLAFTPPTGAPEGTVQPTSGASGSVFPGVFDLGFASTPAEPAQDLLVGVTSIAKGIEQQINDCLMRMLAGQRVSKLQCQNRIIDCVQSQLRIIKDFCNDNQDCIAREINRRISDAWQTAAQFGCGVEPEPLPTPPIGPPTFPEPPIAPQPIPPIELPPIERPPIGPPTFPPRPPRVEPPPREIPPPFEQPPPRKIPPPFEPPILPPRPPIGVEPPFIQCPPDAPLECWLGLPPAPPRIVPFAPGCALVYNVRIEGDLQFVWSSAQFNDRCPNVNEWVRGASQIHQARGYAPLGLAWLQRDPATGIRSVLQLGGRKGVVLPPLPPQPPVPPGAPPAQCPVCCCCPCECPEKEPPEEEPEPEPPEEKPEGEFCCMRQVSGGCYVKRADQNPRASTDTIVGCFRSAAEAQKRCDEECAPPEPPKEPPPSAPSVAPTVDWCDPNIADVAQLTPYPRGLGPLETLLHTLGLVGVERSVATEILLTVISAITKVPVGGLRKVVSAGLLNVGKEIDRIIGETVCIDPRVLGMHGVRGLLSFVSKYVGDNFAEIARPLDHWSAFLCPTEIPSPEQATSAYLADAIDIKQLETWVRAGKFCWPPWQRVLQAQRSKPVPIELREMRRREIISPSQYDDMMRQLGYLEPSVRDNLWKITEVVPPYSDLVHMMVRDAQDQTLVTQFGMDTDFGTKYDGQLKKWFEHQGVPELAARYLWRSHWSIPSPSQLYTMFHRLSRLPVGDPKRVPITDVEAALKQQDILPFWIPKLLEISYLPINRSDATQAFIHGVLTREELHETYLQNGYNDTSAARMVEKTYQQRIRRYWRNPPVRAFIQGGFSEADTRAALQFEGLDQASQDIVINRSKGLRRARLRQRCIAAIQKRFFAGEFDGAGATAEMIGLGVDNDAAIEFAEFWRCELATKGKHFSASVLCGMLERGLITQQEFLTRARRLGWSNDDAIVLAADCLARINIRATKAAEIAARRAESEQRRKDAALKAGLRETAAAQRREQQIIEAAHKAGERREDMILRASERMAGKIESTVADQVPIAKAIWQQLRNVNRLNIDDALQAVVRSAEIFQTDGGFTWAELAENYATGTEEIEGQTNGTVTE